MFVKRFLSPSPYNESRGGPLPKPCRFFAAAAILIVFAPLSTAQVWQPQGPAAALFSDGTDGIADAPVTGAIEALVAHPTNADIIWVGAANGGIFQTTNATAAQPTWTDQTATQQSLSIGALALDPSDTTNNTLVAGIGRTSSFNDGGALTGILRTVNGGNTWTAIDGGLSGRSVSGIVPNGGVIVVSIDKTDSQDTGDAGIFRSIDSGTTFTQVSAAVGSGLPAGAALDLVTDPNDTAVLFTVIQDQDTIANSGIYRSTDAGVTWSLISSAAQNDLINTPAADVDLAAGNSGAPNLFAAICDESALAGLFRTGDAFTGSPVWTELDLPETIENGESKGLHPGSQCSPHMSLVADPVDHNVVFIGGDTQPGNGLPSLLPNSLGAENFVGRLFRVDAGAAQGSQSTSITHCATASAACGLQIRTVNNSAPHADSRDMVFDANGDLLQTDDGGIYKHTDPNGSTGGWVSLIGNLGVTEQHDIAYDQGADALVSGNQDNGSTQQFMFNDTVWEQVFGGDGGEVAVAENTVGGCTGGTPPCSRRYWSAQNQVAGSRKVFDSTNTEIMDEGEPSLTPLGGADAPQARFITPLGVNAANSARMVVGADNGVYESMDNLDSVSLIDGAVVNSDKSGNFFAYGASGNADVLYFGSGDQVFSRQSAPPSALSGVDPDPGSDDDITGVALIDGDGTNAFAVDRDQVFQTTDGGASWIDVTGHLLAMNPGTLRSLAYVSSATPGIAVGTDRGVYVAPAESSFLSWTKLGSDLPNVPVYEMDYDQGDELLSIGTLGRGAWTLSQPVITTGSIFADGFE